MSSHDEAERDRREAVLNQKLLDLEQNWKTSDSLWYVEDLSSTLSKRDDSGPRSSYIDGVESSLRSRSLSWDRCHRL